MFVYKRWSDYYNRYFWISTMGMQYGLKMIYGWVREQEGKPNIFDEVGFEEYEAMLYGSDDNSFLDHVLSTVFEKGKEHPYYAFTRELFFHEQNLSGEEMSALLPE
jgi:hypothetical protein